VLGEHQREVVFDEVLQLLAIAEELVRDLIVGLDALEQLLEARLPVVRCLDVHQLRHPLCQHVLVFESRDLFSRRDPSVAFPVNADEDVALRQIAAVKVPGWVRARAEFEHDRDEVQRLDGFAHGEAFVLQLTEGRADEDAQALIGGDPASGHRG
jgi:hypothetical protein